MISSCSGSTSTPVALKQLGTEMVLIGASTSTRQIKSTDTIGIAHMNTSGFEVSLSGRLVDIAKGEMQPIG